MQSVGGVRVATRGCLSEGPAGISTGGRFDVVPGLVKLAVPDTEESSLHNPCRLS